MTDHGEAPALPVLDLSRLDAGGRSRLDFLAELRAVARRIGFFYVVGHGVTPELTGEVMRQARRFFDLPEAEKLAVEMVRSPHFRGYTRIGREITRGQADRREQLDVGAERLAVPSGPGVPAWTRLQGPNQWPAAQPDLRPILLRWQAEATSLLLRVLRAFALALGQAEDVFRPIYDGDPHQLMKIIRYPGRDAGDSSDQGVGPHKDSGLLSLVLQDDRGGLQVQHEGGWIDAVPVPGAFVVNIGEALELASNGYLQATVHRVVAPPAGTDRISVAFFMSARLDATVPLLDLPPELAAVAQGPSRDPSNPLLAKVGENHLKGRLRSHPDVAARHYADIVGSPAAVPARE
jgi:isopenicillin N synthase-like dioxygenase